MEEVARYESESGMVIDDHLKIATVMNHLRGSIREHLLINSKHLTPWEDITDQAADRQLLLQQLHPAGIETWRQQHGSAG